MPYAFGSGVKERTASFTFPYRFSMNTQEKEPELGEGVTSAEFWVYDGKLGRRWNVDPLILTGNSSFVVNGNNPIYYTDEHGDFKTYFGAFVYRVFNGGKISRARDEQHKDEYYVSPNRVSVSSLDGSGGIKITSERVFNWSFVGTYDEFTLPDVGYSRGQVSERYKETTYGDNWTQGVSSNVLAQNKWKPTKYLMYGMSSALYFGAQADGLKMFEKFCSGSGGILLWPSGSRLSNEVSQSKEFQEMATQFENSFKQHIANYRKLEGFDKSKLKKVNFNFVSTYLTTLIGGFHKITVEVKNIKYVNGLVYADFNYVIYDVFGAGYDDVAGAKQLFPGLTEMYLLQHMRNQKGSEYEDNFRPFINQIIINR